MSRSKHTQRAVSKPSWFARWFGWLFWWLRDDRRARGAMHRGPGPSLSDEFEDEQTEMLSVEEDDRPTDPGAGGAGAQTAESVPTEQVPMSEFPGAYEPLTTGVEPREAWEADAPWEGSHVALSIDADFVRQALKDEFESELKRAKGGDRKFLLRMIRLFDSRSLDLPPFPDIAQELDAILKKKNTTVMQIASVVERDPGLLRRVWTQGSSAMYATSPRSLHHAVARIGLDALWRIGMAVCLNDAVFQIKGFQEEADQARTHGIVAAEVSAWLSGERRGHIYMAGLLHAVGKLILYRTASEGGKLTTPPSKDLVNRLAKRYYPSLGVLVARTWKLHDTVAAGIGYHTRPQSAEEGYERAARIVQAASIATHTADLARQGYDCGGIATLERIDGLIFDPEKAVAKAHGVFEMLSAKVEAMPSAEDGA